MSSKAQFFAELTEQLGNALSSGDWEAIVALSAACSALIGTLHDGDATDLELRAEIEVMTEVYGRLQTAARLERQRLAQELTKLSQGKQVTQAYKPLG